MRVDPVEHRRVVAVLARRLDCFVASSRSATMSQSTAAPNKAAVICPASARALIPCGAANPTTTVRMANHRIAARLRESGANGSTPANAMTIGNAKAA
jgi:hypothetical protein